MYRTCSGIVSSRARVERTNTYKGSELRGPASDTERLKKGEEGPLDAMHRPDLLDDWRWEGELVAPPICARSALLRQVRLKKKSPQAQKGREDAQMKTPTRSKDATNPSCDPELLTSAPLASANSWNAPDFAEAVAATNPGERERRMNADGSRAATRGSEGVEEGVEEGEVSSQGSSGRAKARVVGQCRQSVAIESCVTSKPEVGTSASSKGISIRLRSSMILRASFCVLRQPGRQEGRIIRQTGLISWDLSFLSALGDTNGTGRAST